MLRRILIPFWPHKDMSMFSYPNTPSFGSETSLQEITHELRQYREKILGGNIPECLRETAKRHNKNMDNFYLFLEKYARISDYEIRFDGSIYMASEHNIMRRLKEELSFDRMSLNTKLVSFMPKYLYSTFLSLYPSSVPQNLNNHDFSTITEKIMDYMKMNKHASHDITLSKTTLYSLDTDKECAEFYTEILQWFLNSYQFVTQLCFSDNSGLYWVSSIVEFKFHSGIFCVRADEKQHATIPPGHNPQIHLNNNSAILHLLEHALNVFTFVENTLLMSESLYNLGFR